MGDGRSSTISKMSTTKKKKERDYSKIPADGKRTKEVVKAINDWSGTGYHSVRAGNSPNEEWILENYVQGHSYDGTIYRGFNTADISKFKVGNIINQSGSSSKSGIGLDSVLSSWSASKSVSENSFTYSTSGDEYRVLLTMKGGTKRGCDIHNDSAYPWEKEVLVSGTSKQQIKKVAKKKNWLYVEVEEVLDE